MAVEPLALLLIVIAYLLGSLPSAVVVSRRAERTDVRALGTGIPGTANVYREVGRLAGAVVAVLDIGKGAVAVALLLAADAAAVAVAAGGVAVVLGHWWPVFAGFRGGVGAGPAVGAIVVLAPLPFVIAGPVAGLLLLATRRAWTAGTAAVGGPAVVSLVMDGFSATTLTVALLGALVAARMLCWRPPADRVGSPGPGDHGSST